jgi:translation elongation factor EF-Tu-like GTPase
MSQFVEALLLLLPPEAGGRASAVLPREGSYRPYVRVADRMTRARLIEGPAVLAPGEAARVVMELESDRLDAFDRGAELQVLELSERVVGVVTILRCVAEGTV